MVQAHITGPETTVKTAALILPLDHHLEGNNKYIKFTNVKSLQHTKGQHV